MSVRVLIVEDHKVNRILLSSILEKMGISYDLAENGEEALHKMDVVQYDLILMDVFMPIMNGIECLSKIRNDSRTIISKTPVIAVTAKPETEGLNQFDAIVPKPIKLEVLQAVINDFLTSPF